LIDITKLIQKIGEIPIFNDRNMYVCLQYYNNIIILLQMLLKSGSILTNDLYIELYNKGLYVPLLVSYEHTLHFINIIMSMETHKIISDPCDINYMLITFFNMALKKYKDLLISE